MSSTIAVTGRPASSARSEEHTSELQSRPHLVCRLLLEKKNTRRCRRFSYNTITNIAKLRRQGPKGPCFASGASTFREECIFEEPAPAWIYTLALHDALPISSSVLG